MCRNVKLLCYPWGGNKDCKLERAAFVHLPTASTPSVLLSSVIAMTRFLTGGKVREAGLFCLIVERMQSPLEAGGCFFLTSCWIRKEKREILLLIWLTFLR